MKTCQHFPKISFDPGIKNEPCGKPATCELVFPSGKKIPACAECYDAVILMWKRRLMKPQVPVDEVRYRKALLLNKESAPS